MAKEKFYRSRGVWLILILLGVTFFRVNSSQALLLTNPSVGYDRPIVSFTVNNSPIWWFTQYKLYADELDPLGVHAFCVENVPVTAGLSYELVPVPGHLSVAARIADQFFNGSGWDKTATQIAVWEVAFDGDLNLATGSFRHTGAYSVPAQAILDGISTYSLTGPISLAHSPANTPVGSGSTAASQDYLVPTAPMPEPSTMLLLGAGLIGLFGVGRKKLFKK